VLSLPEFGSHSSSVLPLALVSLTRLLILSEPDFKSARSKGKLPSGNLRKGDVKDNKEVMEILDEVFKQREKMYIGGNVEVRFNFILTKTDLSPLTRVHQDDEHWLSLPETLDRRKRHAVIVRLGEKRILRDIRQALKTMLAEVKTTSGAEHGNENDDTRRNKKGGNGGKEAGTSRKRVVDGAEGSHWHGWKKARR